MQFVIVSLTGWGVVIFGGYKFFTRGNGKKDEVVYFTDSLSSGSFTVVIFCCLGIVCVAYKSCMNRRSAFSTLIKEMGILGMIYLLLF